MSHQLKVKTFTHHFYPFKCTRILQVSSISESRAFKAYLLQTSQLEIEILNCSTSGNMKNQLQEHIIGIPVSCQYDKPSPPNGSGAIIPMRLGLKFSERSLSTKKDKESQSKRECEKPSQKYMEIVTMDNFDFWFMGFLNYQKAFSYLRQAIFQVQNPVQK
ncbi:GEM-like protein 6 [Vitis vinifera]|uniref:GEM-like protein 6 n=1 Tax=Vitis vinifera TaxID=29760 RepID=A0A438GAG2_VITVI|nr:GEM-like protein 6 [Vitis vinifera]